MSIQKIKDFILRNDLDEFYSGDLDEKSVTTTLVSPDETLRLYQDQMLKYVQDFKHTFENEKKTRMELEKAYFQTIMGLSAAVEKRDSYTGGHAERVTKYAILVAQELALPEKEIQDVKLAALLHDIGKISIPDAILTKGARLSPSEFEIMRTHPATGAEILKNIQFIARLVPAVLSHHEAFNGSGYPRGLSGKEIPLGARIIAVVDTYDAIIRSRSYRKGSPPEVGVGEVQRCSGQQFDPEIVEAFSRAWKSGKLIARDAR